MSIPSRKGSQHVYKSHLSKSLMEALKFFWAYLCNLKKIGAIAPSSRYLAERMVENAEVKTARRLAEFGAGTGRITRKILEVMPAEAHLLVFEPYVPFYQELQKIQDARVHLIPDVAQSLPHQQNGFSPLDCILSGIPLANLPRESQREIAKTAYDALRPGGIFVQFQYSLISYHTLRSIFDQVALSPVARNAPPAIVYTCKKK